MPSKRGCGRRSRTAVAPLERLKILMQIQGNQKRYSSVYQGLKHIARTEGIKGMMRGNLTNCIRIVPNQAVRTWCTLTYSEANSDALAHMNDNASDRLTFIAYALHWLFNKEGVS